jgi:tryptophan synthase beta chain
VVAVQSAACPSLTKGRFTYDFGDTSHLTPLVKMHTLAAPLSPLAFTPADCAITAWRLWFRT